LLTQKVIGISVYSTL